MGRRLFRIFKDWDNLLTAKVHGPPILQVDSGLQSATLPHVILESRALALSAVSPLLQAVAGHVEAGAEPGRLVHH